MLFKWIVRLAIVLVFEYCLTACNGANSATSNSNPTNPINTIRNAFTNLPSQATVATSDTISLSPISTPTISTMKFRSIILSGYESPVTNLSWSPNGKFLASSSGGFGAYSSNDNTVHLWKGEDGSLQSIFSGHTAPIASLAWSPNGAILASGSLDQSIRLWGTDGTLLKILKPDTGTIYALAWSPDGKMLASGSVTTPYNNTVHIWKVADGTLLNTLSTDYSGGKFYNLAWSTDGKFLLGGATDYKLWRADGSLIFHLPGCASCTPAWGMAWSPDSKTWAIGNESGYVFVYNVEGKNVAVENGSAMSLAWSPDGKILSGGNKLWGINCKHLATQANSTETKCTDTLLATLSNGSSPTASIAWSPNGKMLAVGYERNDSGPNNSTDKLVRLWDANGALLSTLNGHTGSITQVKWSSDGKILATASQDNTIRLWQLESE